MHDEQLADSLGSSCVRLSTGFASTPVRKRLFTRAFFEKHFPELASDKSKRLPEMGYPDVGAGQFSQKLNVNDWMEFANAQRAHYNYLEGVASILTFLLISGLFFPRYTIVCGAVYIVGRIMYGIGYKSKGSRGRLPGVLILDAGLFAAMGGAAYGAFTFAGGLAGLAQLF
jgi:uncharacterized membrane protein YecN with MAPEG domain